MPGIAFFAALFCTSLLMAALAVGLVIGKSFLIWWTEQPLIGHALSAVLDHFSVFSHGEGLLANLYYFLIALSVPSVLLGAAIWALHLLSGVLSLAVTFIRGREAREFAER